MTGGLFLQPWATCKYYFYRGLEAQSSSCRVTANITGLLPGFGITIERSSTVTCPTLTSTLLGWL